MKQCFGCMEYYEDSMHVCPHCGYEEGTMSQESFQLRPGIVLKGHYLLGKVLGYGGFGTTYLAWDETMRRTVAIKEYLPTVFATRGTERTMVTVYGGEKAEQFDKGRQQFLEEARKLARFTGHESIVGVYDFFEENGTAYIVMEYLDGETLTDYLRRERRMTFEAALRVITPILKALQDVHKEGIIHRDIAPDNIRITKDGKIKLLDFGAAREASVNHSHSLSVIYKPGYAPEEQYQSRGEQGPWTDVYALAATFYRMITGIKPAPALERLVNDTLVPPSELGVRITKNQETALLNALNVRRENRTQSAEAFLQELQSDTDVVRIAGGMETVGKAKKGGAGKIVLIVLLALVLLCGGGFFTCKALGLFDKEEPVATVNETRVPSFVNCTWQEAQVLAKEANLVIEVSGLEYSADIQKDLVLKQNVKSGSVVAVGTKIDLTISGGIKMISMLEVTGLPTESAVNLLTERGFVVEILEVYSVFQKDTVAESSLKTGELYAEGTQVVLKISKGPDESKVETREYTLPNYVGKPVSTLDEDFSKYGIMMGVTWECSDTVAEGYIISQSVTPGTKCEPGTFISFVVSEGKEMVLIPSCLYRDLVELKAELAELGLAVSVTEEYSDNVQQGKIVRQNPKELTEVEKGTMVELVVSLGKKQVTSVSATKVPTKVPTKAPTNTPKPTKTPTPIPATPTPWPYRNLHKAKVGDRIYYGTYEQDGSSTTTKEPIEWIVLAKETDRVLVISRYCLEASQYNQVKTNVVWSSSFIRNWLNTTFCLTAFSPDELSGILFSNIENKNNENSGTYGGEATTDRIFLLSESEVAQYFKENNISMIAQATKHAQNNGVWVDSATKGNCDWWLRTPGNTPEKAMLAQKSGSMAINGSEVQLRINGVRPAMWLMLE